MKKNSHIPYESQQMFVMFFTMFKTYCGFLLTFLLVHVEMPFCQGHMEQFGTVVYSLCQKSYIWKSVCAGNQQQAKEF